MPTALFLTVGLALAPLWPQSRAARGDVRLEQLRSELALRYLDPTAHLELAKYHKDHDQPLLAFYVTEHVRRNLAPEAEFRAAFERVFLGKEPFDNGPEAERALLRRVTDHPLDPAPILRLADVFLSRGDYASAEKQLRAAIALDGEDFEPIEVLAEVLRRRGRAEAAEKLIQDYIASRPDSAASFLMRFERLASEEKISPEDRRAATSLLREGVRKNPKDGDLVFNLANLVQDSGKLEEAEELYLRAASLATDSAHVQGWTARFLFKVRKDRSRALEHYLDAYFLDPDFYESEYAESRIRSIAWEVGRAEIARMRAESRPATAALRSQDPAVVFAALEWVEEAWSPAHVDDLVELMLHDDESIRARAAGLIGDHVDASFDPRLRSLLADPDLRRRGLALYIAAKRWGDANMARAKAWLDESAQLLRYDGASVLLQYGGAEGRRTVERYAAGTRDPVLKKWLEAVLHARPAK